MTLQFDNFLKFNVLILIILFSFLRLDSQSLIEYVQPMSGTGNSTTFASLKHSEEKGTERNANTIPAVTYPFAMTQWTPQTRTTEKKCLPPYFYKDSIITGFRGSHWLSGSCTQDYGSFTIIPVVGNLKTSANNYGIPFTHENEISSPSFYKLTTESIVTEITSSLRCGMMRFTTQKEDSIYILVTPNSDMHKGFIQVNAASGEIWGYNPVHRLYQGNGKPAGFNGWFYIKIDRPFTVKGSFSDDEIYLKDSISNQKDIGVFAGFFLKKEEQINLRIGTSFSSLQGAKLNLESELGDKSFEDIKKLASQTWEQTLSAIEVKTRSERDKRIFYTAMYHSMQHPRIFNDVDGTYPAFSQNFILKNSGVNNYYDDFSMWDIYRAQLPLIQILDTKRTGEFVQSMVLKGEQGKWLPIFPCWNSYTSAMIGDHVTAFIASSYNKGIKDFNIKEAYRLMRKNAFTIANDEDYHNGMGRRAMNSYLNYNFIPLEDSIPIAFHKNEQVSRTLEYAFDDYALSIVAKDIGESDDYKILSQRANNYKNVFDPAVKMMRGRYENGTWIQPFRPDYREFYITEGTPRQYSFYVPHDVHNLANLMGGKNKFEEELDCLFSKEEYWHGNEPGHQIPFMYNYTNAPWKTQLQVRKILSEEYSDGPGGLSGNDDAGQMSAWYIFAAIGFYPVDPVSGDYTFSSSIFDEIKINLPNGKNFQIIIHKNNTNDVFIKKMKLNGSKYSKNFISHKTLLEGGILHIWLQKTPSKWGSKIKNQPKGFLDNH